MGRSCQGRLPGNGRTLAGSERSLDLVRGMGKAKVIHPSFPESGKMKLK